MAKYTLDDSLKKIRFIYRCAGVNVENRKTKMRETALLWSNIMWLETDVVIAFIWILYGIATGGNFKKLIYITPCIMWGMMATTKLFYFLLNQDKVEELLATIRELENHRRFAKSKTQKIVKEETKALTIAATIIIIVLCFALFIFNIRPALTVVIRYLLTGEVRWTLPAVDVYPFDASTFKWWPVAYIRQIWTSDLVFFFLFPVDYSFYVCCTHIKIQFMLLRDEIERLVPDEAPSAAVTETAMVEGNHLHDKLRYLLEWHKVIIRCADLVEGVFSRSALYNYVASSVIICICGFNIIFYGDISYIMVFVVLTFFGMVQVLTLCYFGDMLMNRSFEISTAAYNCKWYYADIRLRKTIAIMMTRAQKPCKLTAGGFADVNLNAFMTILSTSWSYFALLRTMYGTSEN